MQISGQGVDFLIFVDVGIYFQYLLMLKIMRIFGQPLVVTVYGQRFCQYIPVEKNILVD